MVTIEFYATIGRISAFREFINDAIFKGYDLYYTERGGFFEVIFTIKGPKKDVNSFYNQVMKYI